VSGRVVVGLDVGTTAVKAAAFADDGSWRHTVVRDRPAAGAEQDPGAVRDAALGALAECAASCAGHQVLAVSVSTAMHGLIALDAAMRPLTPLLTWADDRAAEQAWRLREDGRAGELHRVTGTPVHPMTPLAKLLWFRERDQRVWAAARRWGGLKEWVLWQLTGAFVTEISSASGTGLLDLAARDWSPAALALTGIGPDLLPPVLATTAILELSAAAARATGLPAGTPVVTGAADGPLGNLGTAATAPGVAGLSLGTSGAARTVVPGPYADPEGRLFCYALTGTSWVVGGALGNGGSVVRWAGDVLAPGESGPDRDIGILRLAGTVPAGSDGLVMRPYLLPERAPLWTPQLRGAYLGLTHRHTRAHLARAAVEGVALGLARIVEDLERIAPVTSVRLTGGAFRAPLWRRVVAAALDRPAVLVSGAEGSALGAAALGLHAVGGTATPEEAVARLDPASTEGEPVPVAEAEAEVYRAMRRVPSPPWG
jgi:gluconokinase